MKCKSLQALQELKVELASRPSHSTSQDGRMCTLVRSVRK